MFWNINSLSYILLTYVPHLVHPSVIEHPVTIQSVYPGEMVNFSCRAEGFSTLSYNWFMVESGSDIGVEIGNATNLTYTISNPTYDQNNTGYYCVATNNEGIALSNTSILIGNYVAFSFTKFLHVCPLYITAWYCQCITVNGNFKKFIMIYYMQIILTMV